jgi:hypothetical protein
MAEDNAAMPPYTVRDVNTGEEAGGFESHEAAAEWARECLDEGRNVTLTDEETGEEEMPWDLI